MLVTLMTSEILINAMRILIFGILLDVQRIGVGCWKPEQLSGGSVRSEGPLYARFRRVFEAHPPSRGTSFRCERVASAPEGDGKRSALRTRERPASSSGPSERRSVREDRRWERVLGAFLHYDLHGTLIPSHTLELILCNLKV